DEEGREMTVAGDEAGGVGNLDEVAVARLHADKGDLALAGAQHRRARRLGEIEAGMEGAAAGKRVLAITEGRTHPQVAGERLVDGRVVDGETGGLETRQRLIHCVGVVDDAVRLPGIRRGDEGTA